MMRGMRKPRTTRNEKARLESNARTFKKGDKSTYERREV
jgi:hypothetical protein